jgi:hypothetical protein
VVTAAARNPHLADFQCRVKLPAEPLAFLLSAAPSLTVLHLDLLHFDEQDSVADNIIAEGLVPNRTLQTLELYRVQRIPLRLSRRSISGANMYKLPLLTLCPKWSGSAAQRS